MKKKKCILFVCDRYGLSFLLKILEPRWERFFEVIGVVTAEKEGNPFVSSFCKVFKIPLFADGSTSTSLDSWVSDLLPDIGIVAEYPKKISKPVIDSFKDFLLNFHPSDLPKFRGGAPIEATILSGESLIITAHKLSEKFDEGDILLKTKPLNVSNLNSETIYSLCCAKGPKLLEKCLTKIKNHDLSFYKQNETTASYMWYKDLTYTTKIDWKKDASDCICKKVLASNLKYGNQTTVAYKGIPHSLTLFDKIYPYKKNHNEEPGKVILLEKSKLVVPTVDGYILSFNFSIDQITAP